MVDTVLDICACDVIIVVVDSGAKRGLVGESAIDETDSIDDCGAEEGRLMVEGRAKGRVKPVNCMGFV